MGIEEANQFDREKRKREANHATTSEHRREGNGSTPPTSTYIHTNEVAGNESVGVASGGLVVEEVLAVGRMVGLDHRVQVVVVPRVNNGVAEHDHRRHRRAAALPFRLRRVHPVLLLLVR